jgi:hypothetical protein
VTTAGRIVCVLALLGVGAPATAQGLGDTAARERSKRAKEKKEQPGAVYTNDDLDAVRPPGEKREEGGSSSSASSESGRSSEGSESEGGSSSERAPLPDRLAADRPYIDALRQAQSEVSAIEDQIRQANAKLNPMSTDYIYGPTGSNNADDELRVRQELSDLQARLNEARQAVAEANRELQSHRQGRPASSSEE